MSRGVNMAALPYIYSRSLGQAVCCSYPENHRCQVLKILKKQLRTTNLGQIFWTDEIQQANMNIHINLQPTLRQ